MERIDARYRERNDAAAGLPVGPKQRFVPTASSFTIGAIFSEEEVRVLLGLLGQGAAGAGIASELGTQLACDLDQSWVRRQYAPKDYPPMHAPHGWHQDGALGFDFLSHRETAISPHALLPMVTCWIALTSCGLDAPGLEIVSRPLEILLGPAELVEERVRARFSREDFWQPRLAPGDALLFPGHILHRTYVTPAMTRARTSLELRFFPAPNLPARLERDHFLRLDSAGHSCESCAAPAPGEVLSMGRHLTPAVRGGVTGGPGG